MKLKELLESSNKKVKVIGVKWEADNMSDVKHLPKNVELVIPSNVDFDDEDELLDFIENELSDKYGFTHNGWKDQIVV